MKAGHLRGSRDNDIVVIAWMPVGLYSWRQQAKHYSMESSLKRQPYTME